jgi:nucleoid DNA-binding protein
MDIDLFSEMIKNLILDNDEVTLPGLGTFVSELMPSTFSDKGYTINPPYRRLSFRQRENNADTSLYDFYSKVNDLDGDTSSRILGDFISGLREQLLTKKLVVLPGLGRLRATKENTFFFIADEDLDIYPYGCGLGPVSLKTHEETDEEVSAAVEELQRIVESAPEPAEKPAPAETPAEAPTEEPEAEPQKPAGTPTEPERLTYKFENKPVIPVSRRSRHRSKNIRNITGSKGSKGTDGRNRRKALAWLLCILGAALLALGIFILLAHIAPDFIDSILYTPEELRIINY